MALVKSKYIDLSAAPWTMHEFFAGSGLVGYGLKGMFQLTILAFDLYVDKIQFKDSRYNN